LFFYLSFSFFLPRDLSFYLSFCFFFILHFAFCFLLSSFILSFCVHSSFDLFELLELSAIHKITKYSWETPRVWGWRAHPRECNLLRSVILDRSSLL
jgi:hypothetical protein